jgi:hypothetical protein
MAKLNNVNQLRAVEWGRSYLWDIQFNEIPKADAKTVSRGFGDYLKETGTNASKRLLAESGIDSLISEGAGSLPFEGVNPSWCPIVDFEDEVADIETTSIDLAYTQLVIPSGTKQLNCSITFIDDINSSMYHWVRSWMNDILNYTTDNYSKANGAKPMNYANLAIKTLGECMKMMTVNKLDNRYNTIEQSVYYVYPVGKLSYKGDSDDKLPSYNISFVKAEIVKDGERISEKSPRIDVALNKGLGAVRRFS